MTRKIINLNEGISEENILVSKQSFDKLMTTAEMMEMYEFRAVSVASKDDSEKMIKDFYIVDKQKVSFSSGESQTQDYFKDCESIRQNGGVQIGIAHSHGYHNPYYSGVDHDGFDDVLADFKGNDMKEINFDFTFKPKTTSFRNKKETNKYFHSFNEISLNLLFNESLSDDQAKKLFENMNVQVPYKHIYTASGIVVNSRSEQVFGIKRFLERSFFILSEDEQEKRIKKVKKDYPQYFRKKENKLFYSLNANIKLIDTTEEPIFNKDSLLEELKRKIIFLGTERPSAFKPKVFVPESIKKIGKKHYGQKDSSVFKESLDQFVPLLLDYIQSDSKYSAWLRQVAEKMFNNYEDGFVKNLLPFKEPKRSKQKLSHNLEEYQQPFYEGLLLELNAGNDFICSLVEKTNQSTLMKKFALTKAISEYMPQLVNGITEEKKIKKPKKRKKYTPKKSVGKKKQKDVPAKKSKNLLEMPIETEEILNEPRTSLEEKLMDEGLFNYSSHNKIIQCDPISKFDDIIQAYSLSANNSENYKELKSVNHLIEKFYLEFFNDYHPNLELRQRVDKLYLKNKFKLGKIKSETLQETKFKEHSLEDVSFETLNREDQEYYYNCWREVRDNYYALEMEKEGNQVFSKMSKMKKTFKKKNSLFSGFKNLFR